MPRVERLCKRPCQLLRPLAPGARERGVRDKPMVDNYQKYYDDAEPGDKLAERGLSYHRRCLRKEGNPWFLAMRGLAAYFIFQQSAYIRYRCLDFRSEDERRPKRCHEKRSFTEPESQTSRHARTHDNNVTNTPTQASQGRSALVLDLAVLASTRSTPQGSHQDADVWPMATIMIFFVALLPGISFRALPVNRD